VAETLEEPLVERMKTALFLVFKGKLWLARLTAWTILIVVAVNVYSVRDEMREFVQGPVSLFFKLLFS